MNVLGFAIYYVKLRLRAAVGLHRTCNPLTVNWRWKYWQRMNGDKRS
jgi:hypothetical protein